VVSKDKYKGVSIPDVFDRLTSFGGSSSAFRGSISFKRTLVNTSDKNIVLERVLREPRSYNLAGVRESLSPGVRN
jgi:hypothetical protein